MSKKRIKRFTTPTRFAYTFERWIDAVHRIILCLAVLALFVIGIVTVLEAKWHGLKTLLPPPSEVPQHAEPDNRPFCPSRSRVDLVRRHS